MVRLRIYNLKGEVIRTLVNGAQNAGEHTVVWDGKDDGKSKVASGIYFYRLSAGSFMATKKLTGIR